MTGTRPGSMAEAEQKTYKITKVVCTGITILFFCLTYLNLFHTNLYMWMHKASGGAHIFGVICFILSVIALLIEPWLSNKLKNEWVWFVLWIALAFLGIIVSCGFNFGL